MSITVTEAPADNAQPGSVLMPASPSYKTGIVFRQSLNEIECYTNSNQLNHDYMSPSAGETSKALTVTTQNNDINPSTMGTGSTRTTGSPFNDISVALTDQSKASPGGFKSDGSSTSRPKESKDSPRMSVAEESKLETPENVPGKDKNTAIVNKVGVSELRHLEEDFSREKAAFLWNMSSLVGEALAFQ